jgi:hypothetical protein
MVVLVSTSCLVHKQYMPGNTELVYIQDTIMNDSSIIEGFVSSIDPTVHYSPGEYLIRVLDTRYETVNDNQGHYKLKIPPGTYSIRCKNATSDKIKEEIPNVKVGPNQKARIDFYMGFIAD